MPTSPSTLTVAGGFVVVLALIAAVVYLAATGKITGAQAMTFLTLIVSGGGAGGIAVASHTAGARSARDAGSRGAK